MKKRNVVMVGMVVAFVVALTGTVYGQTPLPSDASGKYKLNLKAYQGITFAEMFGSVPLALVQPEAEDPDAQTEPAGVCISLGAFVGRLQKNVAELTMEGVFQPTVDEVATILAYLDEYLDTATLPDGSSLRQLKVRSLCEADLREVFTEIAVPASDPGQKKQDGKNEVTPDEDIAGLYEYFDILEATGLTLPWTRVTQNKKFGEFRSLVYGTRFIQRTGRLTYTDFFMTGMDNPLVDDELLNVTQYAIDVGLFGAIHTYRNDPGAVLVGPELTAQAAVGPMAPLSNSCCNRWTRKCQYIGYPSSVCGPTGSWCPMGATWCP